MQVYARGLTQGLQSGIGLACGAREACSAEADAPHEAPSRVTGRWGNFGLPRRCTGMGRPEDRVQDCLDAAAYCEQRAASASDPAAQATFVEAARCWRELARYWRSLPHGGQAADKAPLRLGRK